MSLNLQLVSLIKITKDIKNNKQCLGIKTLLASKQPSKPPRHQGMFYFTESVINFSMSHFVDKGMSIYA